MTRSTLVLLPVMAVSTATQTRAAGHGFVPPPLPPASGPIAAQREPTPGYAAVIAKLSPAENPPSATSWGVAVVAYEGAPTKRFGFVGVPTAIGDAARP